MTPHPPRSAPPAPVRLRLYAWAVGLFLGALEGVLAIGVAGARGGALPLVGVVGAAMVLGTVAGRPLSRHLGRRRTGLVMAVLAAAGAGIAAGLNGVPVLIGAGLAGWPRAGYSSWHHWSATSSPCADTSASCRRSWPSGPPERAWWR